MQNILSSATKIVLLVLVLTLCVGVFIDSAFQKTFEYVIVAVVSFYFGQKSNPSNAASSAE